MPQYSRLIIFNTSESFYIAFILTTFTIISMSIIRTFSTRKSFPRKQQSTFRTDFTIFKSQSIFRTMYMFMLNVINNHKVFYPIIKFITIFMMDVFFFFQSSTQILFHYISMFQNSFTIDRNSFISIISNRTEPIRTFDQFKWIPISFPSFIMQKTVSNFRVLFPRTGFYKAYSHLENFIKNAKFNQYGTGGKYYGYI